MKKRLTGVTEDTIIRVEDDSAFVYTVDRNMKKYLQQIKAEPFVKDFDGNIVEWKISKGCLAIVDDLNNDE